MRRFCHGFAGLIVLSAVGIMAVASGVLAGDRALAFVGVNLAGAEFGNSNLPGKYGVEYTYPTDAEISYFTAKGMNVFRLPFRWERLQRQLYTPLDPRELSRIRAFVDRAGRAGAAVILDPHNYARYHGHVIGAGGSTGPVPAAAFADFWARLAAEFGTDQNVIFGLMNEPHDMTARLWLQDANAAIAAIRRVGAEQLILVPGIDWSGAHSWTMAKDGSLNARVMQNIHDPGNNFAYEAHQYLDADKSGKSPRCVSAAIGRERLRGFTRWLQQHNARGFLGEFAGGRNDRCLRALDNMLTYMDENSDVWLGWTYWAAGPWWDDYIFTLEPVNGVDRAQMAVLARHMGH